MDVQGRYAALQRKVEDFFARALERHPDEIRCGDGCSDCCHVRLSVTGVEAAGVRALLETLDAPTRERLRARARRAVDDATLPCPALDAAGRCELYAARPLVCRSHGVAVRLRDGRGLPVIEACPRNFRSAPPDPSTILDQETLSTVLLAVDAAFAAAEGQPAGRRLALTDLLLGDASAPAGP